MNTRVVEQVRHVCSLGGLQSILAIHRAVPILHAGPGCGQKLWGAIGVQNGGQGSGYAGGHTVPCTNASEQEIIFGGEEKLKTVIENAFRVIDADLFAVLTGCTSDIVGDDVGQIVREFQAEGRRIVWAETGGFKGSNYLGHEIVLGALIEQYLRPAPRIEKDLVNVWAVVPFQDAFWTGVYAELSRLLGAVGLKANIVFGPTGGLDALNRVPAAEFNLLVSPWVGLKTVRQLQTKFGTPFLHLPVLPIGPTETASFLRKIAEYAHIDTRALDAFISQNEDYYY